MPYRLTTGIDANRIDGRLYSGYAGYNFASTELAKASTKLRLQLYSYHLGHLVETGQVTLDARREWLLTDKPWTHDDAPRTWDEVR
jgi:hypothetical protein